MDWNIEHIYIYKNMYEYIHTFTHVHVNKYLDPKKMKY